MTTSSHWQQSVTESLRVWKITRLTTCRPRQIRRHRELPKRSIWRSEGYWATPQWTLPSAERRHPAPPGRLSYTAPYGSPLVLPHTIGIVAARPGRRTALWITAALTILCLGAVISTVVGRESASGTQRTVTVMTRNLYLGANINRPIRAAIGRTGETGVLALGHANHELREVVERTDFATRSRLLADEIAAARPDVLGLQEAALWRHGPMELDQAGRTDATEVDYDFLAILLSDLASRGVDYHTVRVEQESDVEAPAFTGSPFTGTAGSAEDIRLTDRDVILVRRGAGIRIDGSGGDQYNQHLDVNLGGSTFRFVRGYAWADLAIGTHRIRFITTHLESQSARIARAQADELLSGVAQNTSLSTVITCDCNSDPASIAAHSELPSGSGAAYRLITKDHEFADLWLQQPGRAGPGNTASLSELVNDDVADFTRRIDFVLARSTSAAPIVARGAEVTGTELNDRDSVTELWPSDHAGVAVQLQIG
jgi:endonuclease/exonuclease/phosphatase family metal-dependent hydrolase